jgi:hypothetical protein
LFFPAWVGVACNRCCRDSETLLSSARAGSSFYQGSATPQEQRSRKQRSRKLTRRFAAAPKNSTSRTPGMECSYRKDRLSDNRANSKLIEHFQIVDEMLFHVFVIS